MKRLVLVALVVAVATYAASAWSAGSAGPSPARLQQQITALNTKVKKLQKDLKQTDDIAVSGFLVGLCGVAITADSFQGTWQVIDQLSAATQGGKTYFGPQTPVPALLNNKDVCSYIQVARSNAVPPSIAPFQQLINGGARFDSSLLLRSR